ncbi:hypothetical protein [Dactylosporangium sp. NPDC051541]|uniref:hypothetical protein n=1 Tax=Dactylosporangium sp. NPDC051541 TaxID=3363977 RepID=UPI0037881AE0
MLVLDTTALEALFHSHPPLWALLDLADQGQTRLGFPVLAVVEAGSALGASAAHWEPFQWIETIDFLPLEEAVAVEISAWQGTFGARHALWEARHMACPLVTRRPDLYAPGQAEIHVV